MNQRRFRLQFKQRQQPFRVLQSGMKGSHNAATKIVRIITRLNTGGPARHVVWLTQALQPPEFSSVLIAGVVPEGEGDMTYFAAQGGVEPLYIAEMSRELSVGDAISLWKLYRQLRRERPDVIHTHTAKAGTVGRVAGWCYRWLTPGTLVGRPRRVLLIHTYHGHIFHNYYGQLKTNFFLNVERLLARVATDKIVVLSQQQRREIHERFRVGRSSEQFTIIPLGLDLTPFARAETRRHLLRDEIGASASTVLVGIVGRLTEVKNHQLFLRVIAELGKQQDLPPVRFLIVGDGQLRVALEAQARALNIENAVTFLGERHDPENFYPALDIVALTSLNEGTPLTLIEAMANERAVISTKVGGVVDLLGAPVGESDKGYTIAERGISAASGDSAGFAAGLRELIVNADLRGELGARGGEFVRANYSKDRLIRDITDLYRRMTGAGK